MKISKIQRPLRAQSKSTCLRIPKTRAHFFFTLPITKKSATRLKNRNESEELLSYENRLQHIDKMLGKVVCNGRNNEYCEKEV